MKQKAELENIGIDIADEISLPCIPLRNLVAFPDMDFSFDIARKKSIAAAKSSINDLIFVVTQMDSEVNRPAQHDLYSVGVIAEVKQLVKRQGGAYRCVVDTLYKAELLGFTDDGIYCRARVRRLENYAEESIVPEELEAISREVKSAFIEYASQIPNADKELAEEVLSIDSPYRLFETIAYPMPVNFKLKQELLEIPTCSEKLISLLNILNSEIEILQLESEIREKVHEAINQNQRDFYIREQIRALQEELGESPDLQGDWGEIEEYRAALDAIRNIDDDTRKKLSEEIEHLAKMPSFSQEAAIIRNYLDICLALPWDAVTEDNSDISDAARILDEDHYGIRKVKDRILENLAVRALTPDLKGQIICLSGPPGVGKTSVAKSIARALGRKYVRVSLGGVRDESDIRGHRKTYLGAMPGRIIAGLKQVGVSNPVMLLDEIDKMANDSRGDPSSAMLEVLDSEQNSQFRDHFTEIPFDLSKVLFITTANNLDLVSPPLLDRMEVIEMSSYTREEKFHIAKEHLIPKQIKRHGLKVSQIRFADSAVYAVIDGYTREAGVRKLEREIASLCRKAAKEIVDGAAKVSFKAANIEQYLGHKKYLDDFYSRKPQVGCVNGLAWTSVGGVIMPLEALILDGKGKVTLTGSLGDVMKESAALAVSNARRLADSYGYSSDFYEKKDIHIHAPEGAVPKDGPSAGVTMVTALVSALSGIKVRSDIAMTGEITLTGRVLPIGGLREKSMAAYKEGIRTVIIPAANKGDLDELDDTVREAMVFITAEKVEDVLEAALVSSNKSDKTEEQKPKARRGRKPKSAKPDESGLHATEAVK